MPAHLEPHQFARSALGLNIYQSQAETLAAVGKGFPSALCAVNGSGKSSTVISALLIWFLSEYPAGRCIITSGSWSQLKVQVFDSARRFSDLPICRGWEFLDASIKTPAGGFCLGISVDENWRAEGFHQRDGSPVLLIVDEAKAVADPVFESFDKCTPTFKLVTSSAGPASGRFHRYFSSESAYWFRRKVTYLECPHMNDQQRLADLEIYGEHSTFYRNRWLSEFATDSGESVISLDLLRECIAHPPAWVDKNHLTAGCDFAAGGGDLCCLSTARGNKLGVVDAWSHRNPKHSAGKFLTLFRTHNPPLQSHQITGDAGGLGVGFLYDLQADSVIMACMTGWGGLPSSLNPAGDKAFRDELASCNHRMERYRSPFATPFVRF